MKKQSIGLALGSGAAKGFAHIGVLKALEECGIYVDSVSGSSAGALIGGLYCAGRTIREIEHIARKVNPKDWVDLTIPTLGVIKGRKIENMIKKFTDDMNIEDLDRKFIAVATNLKNSQKYVFDSGPLHTAIRASISIPGVFEPVILDGMTLVDGAVVDRVPVSELRRLNVDKIIAVNLGFTNLNADKINILDIIIQSVELLTDQAMKSKALDADIVIEPNLLSIAPSRFDLVDQAMDEGYRATLEKIDEIKEKINLK